LIYFIEGEHAPVSRMPGFEMTRSLTEKMVGFNFMMRGTTWSKSKATTERRRRAGTPRANSIPPIRVRKMNIDAARIDLIDWLVFLSLPKPVVCDQAARSVPPAKAGEQPGLPIKAGR